MFLRDFTRPTFVVVLVCLSVGSGSAQEAGEARTRSALDLVTKANAAAQTRYVEGVTTRTTAQSPAEASSFKAWFAKPSRLVMTRQASSGSFTAYIKPGELITYYGSPRNEYSRVSANTLVPDIIAKSRSLLPSAAFLLFSDTPTEKVLEGSPTLHYQGEETVGMVPCYKLVAQSASSDLSLYINAGGHLVRSTLQGRSGTPLAGISEDTVYRIVDNSSIPEESFIFRPPAGAREVPAQ